MSEVIDWRDTAVENCSHAYENERGYGFMSCQDCVYSSGTVYADGYISSCYNAKEGEIVETN